MDALTRIRVLRRDGYRCMHRTPQHAVCGLPARAVSDADTEEGSVPLCPAHAREAV